MQNEPGLVGCVVWHRHCCISAQQVVTQLQCLSALPSEQKAQLEGLFVTLCRLYPVSGPHNESTLVQLGANEQSHVRRGAYSAKLSDAGLFLEDFGSFVMNTLVNHLDAEHVRSIERSTSRHFAAHFDDICRIAVLRDDRDEAEDAEDLSIVSTMLVEL